MIPDMEAMLTIEPEPRSSIALPTSRQHQNTPVRFTEMTASHSSSGTSSEGMLWTIPAVFVEHRVHHIPYGGWVRYVGVDEGALELLGDVGSRLVVDFGDDHIGAGAAEGA